MPGRWEAPTAILGRLLLATIFLISPLVNLVPNFGATVAAMTQAGVPLPAAALVIANAMLLAGSLMLILGYRARLGALLLILFLLPATYVFHAPWRAIDGADAGQQAIHFTKNLGLMGAMLLVTVLGPGPGSLKGRRP
ncbi:MAG: DoxX family protein [Hyphomicrobiaceae bacterium]|nr:MAG: DoxX family protein [Hyphomicrobiaceae bacterium]